jgi:hypothetical protein
MDPGGVFLRWEYVGPSRSQYSAQHLGIIGESAGLDPVVRQRLVW